MRDWLTDRRVVAVGIAVIAIPVIIFIVPGGKSTKHLGYHLFPNRVSRAIVVPIQGGMSRGGPRRPSKVSFESSNGAVSVYVIEHGGGEAEAQVKKMMEVSERLEKGIEPDPVVGKVTADRGEIKLNPALWERGQYLVLLHSDHETDVTLHITYGR